MVTSSNSLRDAVSWLSKPITPAVAIAIGGWLSNRVYYYKLHIPDAFNSDSYWELLQAGGRQLIAPAGYILFSGVIGILLLIALDLVRRPMSGRRWPAIAARLPLPSVVAKYVRGGFRAFSGAAARYPEHLLFFAVLLLVIVSIVISLDVFVAVGVREHAAGHPPSPLTLEGEERRLAFRYLFTTVAFASGVAWLHLEKSRRALRKHQESWLMLYGAAGFVGFTIIALLSPHRVLFRTELEWFNLRGRPAVIVGATRDSVRLYKPCTGEGQSEPTSILPQGLFTTPNIFALRCAK